jgi:hypothetical protein
MEAQGAPPPIDPTKNVLETIDQERRYQDAMREELGKRIDQRIADDRYYGERIAGMLAKSVESTTLLLATQVNDRLTKLEVFRYESGGKSAGISASVGAIVAAVTVGAGLAGAIFTIIGALSRTAT